MGRHEALAAAGERLFRYRSWIPPLVLIPLWAGARDLAPGEPPGLPAVGTAGGVVVAALGLLVRALVVGHAPAGTSGKNRIQLAERLTTTGLYSVVRHPLYLGNLLLWLGPAIATGRWWATPVVAAAFGLCYGPIIHTEEAFLERAFGDAYHRWAAATPALLPAVRRWRPAELPFSLKTVLRQEYYAFFSTVAMFAALEAGTRWVQTGRPGLGAAWTAALLLAGLASAGLRYLQRHSTVLDAPGR